MGVIGKVTGLSVEKNKDSDGNVLLLQVELSEESDIQSVELMRHAGVDYTPHSDCYVHVSDDGSFLIATACDDGIEPETDAGEYEIYSSSGYAGSKLAKVKCDLLGNVLLNDGTDPVAGEGDTVTIDDLTDPAFMTLMKGVASLIGAPPPASVTGKISSGRSTVKVP